MKEIQSGADYADYVINGIIEIEKSIPENEKMPDKLLAYWVAEIAIHADITWLEYITGKRDYYEFNEEEMSKVYNLAGMRYTQDLLDGLVDKGMVEVSVGENGDLLYSATEEGKQAIKDDKEAE